MRNIAMRRATLALVVGFVGVNAAHGSVTAAIDTFEEVWDYHTAAITGESHNQQGNTWAQIHYPDLTGYNSGGYVDAHNQTLRAYAVADATSPGSPVWFPSPLPPSHKTDRPLARVNASFRNQLWVGAGTSGLSEGDAVQVQFQMHLDGQLRVGPVYTDPGSISSWAEMSARYTIKDPSLSSGGEGWVPPLMDFDLTAYAKKDASRPSTYYPKGSLDESYKTYWKLTTNVNEPLEDYIVNDTAVDYPVIPYAGSEPIPDTCWNINTGLLTVQIATYIGAKLDLEGGMYLLMQSRYDAPKTTGDFLNTFAVDFAPGQGFGDISLTLESTPVPEPTAAVLVLFGATAMIARPRRSRD